MCSKFCDVLVFPFVCYSLNVSTPTAGKPYTGKIMSLQHWGLLFKKRSDNKITKAICHSNKQKNHKKTKKTVRDWIDWDTFISTDWSSTPILISKFLSIFGVVLFEDSGFDGVLMVFRCRLFEKISVFFINSFFIYD